MKAYEKPRETWIDGVKIVACLLVVLGHFYQSMVTSQICQETALFLWFNKTVYYFHVQLFFICSGYLYQAYSTVDSPSKWRKSVFRKILSLGIPYVVFSTITYLIKHVFASFVNTALDTSILDVLFVHPTSPYWYLYTLFLIFFITPTFQNRRYLYCYLSAAFIAKLLTIYGILDISVYAVNSIMSNMIWFMLGMLMAKETIIDKLRGRRFAYTGVALILLFIIVSVFIVNTQSSAVDFLMGLLACASIILIAVNMTGVAQFTKFNRKLSEYTLPVFLLHVLCAATVRSILFKIGITSAPVHVSMGLVAGLAGPIIIAQICRRIWILDFLIYPTKYIKAKHKRKEDPSFS